jgi:hypothetical protein
MKGNSAKLSTFVVLQKTDNDLITVKVFFQTIY